MNDYSEYCDFHINSIRLGNKLANDIIKSDDQVPMAAAVSETTGPRRKVAKEVRRQQLILATINSIAKRGFADTTLSHVSKQAGLSQGIVNLHFNNKETLLVETLRYLRDDYRQAWEAALEAAGKSPAERVAALIDVDFTPSLCDRRKLAVWFAFQGEAKSRPTYRQICEENDALYADMFSGILQELIDEGNYEDVDASVMTQMLTSLCEGLWLSLLVSPGHMSPEEGLQVMHTVLAKFFPNHFGNET